VLEKFVGEKIEMLPKQPKENEQICDTCGGIGWLWNKENGFIEKCRDCYDGIINLCQICHQPKRGMCMNKECRDIHDKEAEQKRFDKAIKSQYKDVPAEHKEMLYSDSYGYNEGYFSDIDEFIEYCEDNDIEIPKYVWSADKIRLSISADNIIEQACEELHEDAYQNVTDEAELQDFLDAWCAKQSGTDTFSVNYKYAIWTS
jgi:hypothetical protein